jgi:hypothetical protein
MKTKLEIGEVIEQEPLSWPVVTVVNHRFGGREFRAGKREIGHIHGGHLGDLPFPRVKKGLLIVAITLTVAFLSWSQTNRSYSRRSPLDGTWELVSGQALPKGARDIKIISGGHFIFVAYDTEKGKLLYTGVGTFILNGSAYTEHVDFASDEISAGLVGKDQSFTVTMDEDSFTQKGTLSNGKPLLEIWKRMN